MEVILKENIHNLGKIGDIVKVSRGYALNFLIPKNLAIIADKSNKKALNNHLKMLERKKQKIIADLEDLAKKLESISLTIKKKVGENNKIFGSVTSLEIVESLQKEHNIELKKDQIKIEEPIRTIGIFTMPVRLSEKITASLKVWVVSEE